LVIFLAQGVGSGRQTGPVLAHGIDGRRHAVAAIWKALCEMGQVLRAKLVAAGPIPIFAMGLKGTGQIF